MKILQCCGCGLSAPALTNTMRELGHDVILADADPINGAIKVPPGSDQHEFVKAIEDIAAAHGPIVVLPHNHNETFALANVGGAGKKWRAMVPSPLSLRNTHNKELLIDGLRFSGLPRPDRSLDKKRAGDIFSNLQEKIYKPVAGCGSGGIIDGYKLKRRDDVWYLIMERLNGVEYTIDAVCNRGNVIDWCARERVKTHGGICVDARVLGRQKDVEPFLRSFAHAFCLHGPYAIQGFYDENLIPYDIREKIYTPGITFTDCNPRFGGGSGLSTLAGWRGVENYCRLVEDLAPIVKYDIEPCRVRRWYREEMIEG